jgi:hypothetical protein
MAAQAQDTEKNQQKLTVSITYNGMNQSFDYTAQEAAEALRVRALNRYDVPGPDREQNFLFGPDNQMEIIGTASIGSQVQPGSQLYLRPRTAGGG